MPRSIEISVDPQQAEVLLKRLAGIAGVIGYARHRGASLQPPGDVLSIKTSNDATRQVFQVLEELRIAEGGSIATSEPHSIIASDHQDLIDRESNETIWDEMAFLLRQDTNLAPNYLALMALAGAVAAAGLWSDTLHLVIGAMVIAPAFEPLVRIPFGFIAGSPGVARTGFTSALWGYLAMIVGAALAMLILQLVDPERGTNLQTREWVQYWSTVTSVGVLTSAFAAAAGAIVISGQRSVLTTGVMVALALVPSISIVGMGAIAGDFALAAQGLVRWAVDAVLVMTVSALVLLVKHAYLHPHRALS